MRKGLFVGLAGIALLWSSPAYAEDAFAWDNYCINDAFVVCASVRITVTGETLKMQVWNLEGSYLNGTAQGQAHTITAIGLYHTGGWTGTGSLSSVTQGAANITNSWKASGNEIKTLGGIDVSLAGATRGNAGINGCTPLPGGEKWQTCIPDGDPYVEFTFELKGWDSAEHHASDFELRWHSKQVNGEYSLKCDTGGYGDYGPCTAVPEPFTVALLGSGLVGMGGFALRRRKKGSGIKKGSEI
jgi:hypothetical protein